jgi:hypothetical protein
VDFLSNDLAGVGRRAEIRVSPLLFGPNLLLLLILFHGCFFSRGIFRFEVMMGFCISKLPWQIGIKNSVYQEKNIRNSVKNKYFSISISSE